MATKDLQPEFAPESAPESGIRARVRRLVENPVFQKAIMALIVVNAFTLGMETSPTVMAAIGSQLLVFDQIVIVIFCVEIVLRLYAHGPRFFRDPWSVFDFIVVAITLTPSNDSLSVLRSLRVLRVLRLVSAVPRLRRIVAALLHAVPGVGAIGALLMLVFYVFAVITTKLFGAAFPDWFGTIGGSMFQIMTLESWSMGIVRPVMETFSWAWAVFVSFIFLSSFTVLNLFIAIIIDSMQTLHEKEQQETVGEVTDVVHDEHRRRAMEFEELKREMREIKTLLKETRP